MSDSDQTIPLSCGRAWIKYSAPKPLADGFISRKEVQRAFDAGWDAAMAAIEAWKAQTTTLKPEKPKTIATVSLWVIDANGNKCSFEYFGSEEDALEALQNLKNCKNCINCINCVDCQDCERCEVCSNCSDCVNCNDCKNCKDCSLCSRCTDCEYCIRCILCTSCDNCDNCNDSTGKHCEIPWSPNSLSSNKRKA